MSARLSPLSALLAAVLAVTLLGPLRGDGREVEDPPVDLVAGTTNPVTPGSFTGYGFDQCNAPSQAAMDAWMEHSPFMAVGIYLSGNSRACREQRNLTATWVRNQLARGWRLLPITLGPQASCSPRYPKYGPSIDPTINATPDNNYVKARAQGKLEAERAVAAATARGIVPKSTLFYDLEAFDIGNTRCRESAIRFVHAWTRRLHELNYQSGFYSSAGSGIKMLDNVRAGRATTYKGVVLPDYLWIARWDGRANTSVSSAYLSPTAWLPGRRVKQYQGGHDETWGGVRINIDRNMLNLGNTSKPAAVTHCGGIDIDPARYLTIKVATTTYRPNAAQVRALKCLLTEESYFSGDFTSNYGRRIQAAVRNWQQAHGFNTGTTWTTRHWMSLLADGQAPVLKFGSRGEEVRRAQRAIRAAMPELKIVTDGVYDAEMRSQVNTYLAKVGLPKSGNVNTSGWRKLRTGTL